MPDHTKRFSSRVSHYVRSRPGYPPALLAFLQTELSLSPSHRIADVGAGTGILSQLFLNNGNTVFAIEPNAEMRAAAEELLAGDERFRSIDATAEATSLPDASVEFVTAGQAFHWFDPRRSAGEFKRILVSGGWTALVWNERPKGTEGFNAAYDRFLQQHTSEPGIVSIRGGSMGVEPAVATFFGPDQYETVTFPNHQDLDWDGLLARVYSSSYMPLPEDSAATAMTEQLRAIYDSFAKDGFVRIEYETRVFYGKL